MWDSLRRSSGRQQTLYNWQMQKVLDPEMPSGIQFHSPDSFVMVKGRKLSKVQMWNVYSSSFIP